MKNTITEVRILLMNEVRLECIAKNWYTRGNNEEYNLLLQKCNKDNITTEDIVDVAEDIKLHSDTEYDVCQICFVIGKLLKSLFS